MDRSPTAEYSPGDRCTRLPTLRLASLRAKNRVSEGPMEQLYLSSVEVDRFFQEIKNRMLSNSQVQAVFTATKGWPAGVRMIGLTLRPEGVVQPV